MAQGPAIPKVTATDLDIRDLTSVSDSVSAVQSGTWNVTNVSGTVSLPTGASTSAKQDTIITHLDGVEGLLTTIDADTGTIAGAVSGTEMQVDIVGSLPAGSNAIGKLSANSGVDIGDVDVTSVIPGEYGKKPNDSQIEISAKASYQNFTYLLSKGLKTIPVFHQHEEIKWLEKYINETDYIGISPANDLTTKKRMEWMDQVYYLLKGKIKTHSFGGIAEDILKRYPLYSGDSSSWNSYCRWYRTTHIKYDKIATGKNDQKQIAKQQIKIYQEIEANITKLWKYRGIIYD